MLAYAILIILLGLIFLLTFMPGQRFQPSRMTLAAALVALLCLTGYAAYREHLAGQEITEIRLALDAIKAEDAPGRQLTAEEVKKRSERLSELSDRLAALRRR